MIPSTSNWSITVYTKIHLHKWKHEAIVKRISNVGSKKKNLIQIWNLIQYYNYGSDYYEYLFIKDYNLYL